MVAANYPTALNTIFKAGSWDGLVAVEQNARSPKFTQATSHTGTKANSGCNSRLSAYLVHWSMANTAHVPDDVQGLPIGTAGQDLSNAGFGYRPSGKGSYVNTPSPLPTQLTGLQHSVTDPVSLTLGEADSVI